MKYLLLFTVLMLALGCTKKSTPEKALRGYVNYRFESGQDKGDLLDMTTGKLREKIESLEDEKLKEFLKVENLNQRKLKVLVKNCNDNNCFLTYVLSYAQGVEKPKEFGVEVKKIAKVEKIDKEWFLSDVSNVKTYIEARKNIEVSSEGDAEVP